MDHDIYRSTDTGAGVIDNNNGSFAATLDKVLVTGNSTQSITSLTHSAGTISANKTAHGHANGATISISGAAPDTYNGRVTITVVDADNFTYAPVNGNPASSPATGTILSSGAGAKAGLGWELVATGTNIRLYRPRFGTRMYFGIDDNVNVYEMRVRGFESQSNAGVGSSGGTGLFPSAAQLANGCFWQKTTNSAGNRPWVIMGDDKRMFYFAQVDTSTPAYNGGWFGDITSYKAGDAYNCLLIGKAATQSSSGSDQMGSLATNVFAAATTGHYMPRSYTQAGSSLQVGKLTDNRIFTNTSAGNGTAASNCQTYPDPISGGLDLSRFVIFESTGVFALRGYMPGLWNICHNFASMSGVAHADTFSGSNALAGMTFELSRLINSGNSGCIALETTAGAWT